MLCLLCCCGLDRWWHCVVTDQIGSGAVLSWPRSVVVFGCGALLLLGFMDLIQWRYGFGVWFFALEIDYGNEHKEQEHV